MKAITICQPYAWLFTLPTSDPRHKRVENRRWACRWHRGPILIHAGKSRDWLKTWIDITPQETSALIYGAIIAQAELVDCLHIGDLRGTRDLGRLEWVRTHRHAQGPWCFVLENVQPVEPIYCTGGRGLWELRTK